MTLTHRIILYSLLGVLGVSLTIPGLRETFGQSAGKMWLAGATADAKNHLRALNGMMTALGIIALWAMVDLQHARLLVMALGVVMAGVVIARIYSMMVDGVPGPMTWVYLGFEVAMAIVFVGWAPPAKG